MRLRVLQLGPYPPPHGGVQTNLVAIRRALQARGDSAPVANLTRFRREPADGVHYPKTALALLALLFRLDYEILHIHVGGRFTARLQLLCLVCTLLPRVRTVLTFHSGGYPGSSEGRALHSLTFRALVLRRLDRVIAVNSEIAQMFGRAGVPPDRIRVIAPHDIASMDAKGRGTHCEPLPQAIAEFFEAHQPTLVSVGGLEPEYNLEVQIRLVPLLREQFPDAGLVIVGGGSLGDELKQQLSTSPMGAHVLLTGDLPHHHTLRAIEAADVAIRTTSYDGDSVSVWEALHLGTPVVATDNGMRPPGVRTVPLGDLEALRAAVGSVLVDGRNGASLLASRASSGNVGAVLGVYRELQSVHDDPLQRRAEFPVTA